MPLKHPIYRLRRDPLTFITANGVDSPRSDIRKVVNTNFRSKAFRGFIYRQWETLFSLHCTLRSVRIPQDRYYKVEIWNPLKLLYIVTFFQRFVHIGGLRGGELPIPWGIVFSVYLERTEKLRVRIPLSKHSSKVFRGVGDALNVTLKILKNLQLLCPVEIHSIRKYPSCNSNSKEN